MHHTSGTALMALSNKRNQRSLEKRLILGLRQGKPQASCSARKTVVKKQRMEVCQRDIGANKEPPNGQRQNNPIRKNN